MLKHFPLVATWAPARKHTRYSCHKTHYLDFRVFRYQKKPTTPARIYGAVMIYRIPLFKPLPNFSRRLSLFWVDSTEDLHIAHCAIAGAAVQVKIKIRKRLDNVTTKLFFIRQNYLN